MAEFRGFMVHFVWGGGISFRNGWLSGDDTSLRATFPLYQKLNCMALNEMAYRYVGADPRSCTLKMILWNDFFGNVCPTEIFDDNSLETMYFMSRENPQYNAQIEIQFEQVLPTQQSGFVDELRNIMQSSQVLQTGEGVASTSHSGGVFVDEVEVEAEEENAEDDSGDGMSTPSEGTLDEYSVDEDVSEDDENVNEVLIQDPVVSPFGFLNVEDEAVKPAFDDDDGQGWDCFNKDTGVIRK